MKKILTLIVLVGIGVFVGNYFSLDRFTSSDEVVMNESETASTTENIEEVDNVITEDADADESTETSEGSVLNSDVLNPEQKDLLESFGIDTEGIVVTKEMISCAEEKLGKKRIEEIYSGALPTFFEGINLLPCYK